MDLPKSLYSLIEKPRAMVPTAYKVKIDRPRQGDVIDQLFTIEGTYAPPLPPGYDLDVIEVWPNWGTYRWKARASRDGKGTWKATQVWGAGEAGEERAFIIAITGQGGRALFD